MKVFYHDYRIISWLPELTYPITQRFGISRRKFYFSLKRQHFSSKSFLATIQSFLIVNSGYLFSSYVTFEKDVSGNL